MRKTLFETSFFSLNSEQELVDKYCNYSLFTDSKTEYLRKNIKLILNKIERCNDYAV